MKKTVIFLLVCLLLTAAPFPARSYAAEEDAVSAAADDVDSVFVRVRLSTGGAQRVCIAVEGTYRCNGTPFTGGTLTLRLRGEHVTVTHSELGLLSDNPFIYIERLDPDPWDAFFTLDNARYGECRYLGDLFGCIDDEGKLCLVNYVPMTQYLYGVTGGELRNTHPIEALKAQTIAAKGYALSRVGSSGAYDLTDRATAGSSRRWTPLPANTSRWTESRSSATTAPPTAGRRSRRCCGGAPPAATPPMPCATTPMTSPAPAAAPSRVPPAKLTLRKASSSPSATST